MISGILIINKPAGPTSHDIVDKIRRITKVKKVGHAGTLDPFAKGVLIILINKATKAQQKFMILHKTYTAIIFLGAVSNTYDKTGNISVLNNTPPIKRNAIKKILKNFTGEIKQIPPAFSAIKINGKRAYELARKGIKLKLKPRKIKIYNIKLLKYNWPYLEIKIKCSKGTYIRSLANDIGKKLGCGAYLKELTRNKIGKFNLKKAINLDKITKDNWQNYISMVVN